ncbi:pirin family protein [Caulobacter sp. RHG1]|uniref:pirin family protein n=1 Tax=Caulobacter sp. (strain RHG1) TaxID=2545762 RepID=UPI001551DB21|nr:pirin family protein [Caulobacter sp. RHG1]NQE61065.1 Pirin [Caulobacter sp. RHG1]
MIDLVIEARRHDIGNFEVGRVLPFHARRMVGPFTFLDHMGPAEFAPGFPKSADVRPHPHIGLSTLSYLFQGEITHRDSVGSETVIKPGEVNWMTAGSGITHSERFETLRRQGGRMDGMQAWIALPKEFEETDPGFVHIEGDVDLPTYEERGLKARLIAGEAFGAKANVPIFSPLFYVHWELEAGATAALPAEYAERAAYVADGRVEVDGRELNALQMAVFEPGDTVVFKALERSTVMLLGGEPVGPRFMEWNFVSSSKERIEQAKADWKAGRMKLPDLDHDEFIPLPETPKPPQPL